MKINDDILKHLAKTFDRLEQGAILGVKDGNVNYFHIDDIGNSRSSKDIYTPDCNSLNQILKEWRKDGISFCGMVHSHSTGKTMLSKADTKYAQALCSAFELEDVLMPVIEIGIVKNNYYIYSVDVNGEINTVSTLKQTPLLKKF